MSNRDDVIVKKVKPFPIPGQIKSAAGATFPIHVVKLTTRGFLAEIPPSPVQPGEKFEVSFEFPVLHRQLNELVVVVKLYQSWGSSHPTTLNVTPKDQGSSPQAGAASPGAGIIQLIEMHFMSLSPDGRKNIDTYLAQAQKRSS